MTKGATKAVHHNYLAGVPYSPGRATREAPAAGTAVGSHQTVAGVCPLAATRKPPRSKGSGGKTY